MTADYRTLTPAQQRDHLDAHWLSLTPAEREARRAHGTVDLEPLDGYEMEELDERD